MAKVREIFRSITVPPGDHRILFFDDKAYLCIDSDYGHVRVEDLYVDIHDGDRAWLYGPHVTARFGPE